MISVIIPTYNRDKYLFQALTSLTKQSLPASEFEVVVVDDGSTDNTENVIFDFVSDFEIIFSRQSHRGVSQARNFGINDSHGYILVFFDDDAIAASSWLENIKRIMESENIITGSVEPIHNNIWKYFAPHYHQADKPQESSVLLEGNCAIKRYVFESIGQFDANLDYGHEGKEFIHRASRFFKIMYYPEMVIYHDYASGLSNYLSKQWKFGEKMSYLNISQITSLSYLLFNYQKIKSGGQKIEKKSSVLPFNLKLKIRLIAELGKWSHFFGAIYGYLKYKKK